MFFIFHSRKSASQREKGKSFFFFQNVNLNSNSCMKSDGRWNNDDDELIILNFMLQFIHYLVNRNLQVPRRKLLFSSNDAPSQLSFSFSVHFQFSSSETKSKSKSLKLKVVKKRSENSLLARFRKFWFYNSKISLWNLREMDEYFSIFQIPSFFQLQFEMNFRKINFKVFLLILCGTKSYFFWRWVIFL